MKKLKIYITGDCTAKELKELKKQIRSDHEEKVEFTHSPHLRIKK